MTPATPDEWAAVVSAQFDDVVGPDTLTGSVQIDVTGGPDGDRSVHAEFERGHLSGAAAGPVGKPRATLTVTASDASAILAGDLDPSVVFMRGQMKVSGDMGLVLDLLALANGDEVRVRRQRIAGLSPG